MSNNHSLSVFRLQHITPTSFELISSRISDLPENSFFVNHDRNKRAKVYLYSDNKVTQAIHTNAYGTKLIPCSNTVQTVYWHNGTGIVAKSLSEASKLLKCSITDLEFKKIMNFIYPPLDPSLY